MKVILLCLLSLTMANCNSANSSEHRILNNVDVVQKFVPLPKQLIKPITAKGVHIKNSLPSSPYQTLPIHDDHNASFYEMKVFSQEALTEHNRLRQIHNANPLKIDDNLAKKAQSWAYYLANADIVEGFNYYKDFSKSHNSDIDIYQNVVKFDFPFSGKDMTDWWYLEVKNYDFNANASISSSFYIEEFIQIIWKSTTRVGFGRAKGKNGYFGVAYYSPSGNKPGQFDFNISKPSIPFIEIIKHFKGPVFDPHNPINVALDLQPVVKSSSTITKVKKHGKKKIAQTTQVTQVNPAVENIVESVSPQNTVVYEENPNYYINKKSSQVNRLMNQQIPTQVIENVQPVVLSSSTSANLKRRHH